VYAPSGVDGESLVARLARSLDIRRDEIEVHPLRATSPVDLPPSEPFALFPAWTQPLWQDEASLALAHARAVATAAWPLFQGDPLPNAAVRVAYAPARGLGLVLDSKTADAGHTSAPMEASEGCVCCGGGFESIAPGHRTSSCPCTPLCPQKRAHLDAPMVR